MEALKWLQEYKRMCENGCDVCPMFIENNKHNVACSYLLKKCPEDTYKIVEQWSKEHPIITNARKFEEVFGLSGHRLIHPGAQWWNELYKKPEDK